MNDQDIKGLTKLINHFLSTANKRFDLLEGKMVTKQDLEQFATKQDLENFATKQDLEQFATKYDIEELEQRLKERMVSKDDFRQAYGKLDQVMGEVLKVRQEQAAHQQQHDDMRKEIKDHKDRFRKLESKRAVA